MEDQTVTNIGSPKIGVESFILMIEHILVSVLFDLTRATLLSLPYINIVTYSNVNVLRDDNNVTRVKSKRIEMSICPIINIKLSTPIFGLPMVRKGVIKIKIL